LNHYLEVEWLKAAYERVKPDSPPGVDGQSWADYGKDLEKNLRRLLDQVKSGSYVAPPVKRVHIPKGDGKETRPIGMPTLEDKVLQRAVAMLLEPIYEQDFKYFSYGFRPERSAHEALACIWSQCLTHRIKWILDVDVRKYFDTLRHETLGALLDLRVRDGVIRRLIGKWLHAGVLDRGQLSYPEEGTPQGGVISPLLANIYLHYVLDGWYVESVKPLERPKPAGAVRGRLHPRLREARGCGKGPCGALPPIREIWVETAPGEDAPSALWATEGPDALNRGRGEAAGHLRLSGLYPLLGQDAERRLGDSATDRAQAV
jgi:hypothetical protein